MGQSLLSKITGAIARQEGWNKVNSLSSRNNNPGNLKFGPRAKRFGATRKDRQGHAIFPNARSGWAALEDLIESKDGKSLTVIGVHYAEDPNWAMNVARIARVNPVAPLYFTKGLTPEVPWLKLALAEVGTTEWAGTKSNPKVGQYYVDAGAGLMLDAVPWCAAFVGAMLKRAGGKPSGSLMARSYLKWGERTEPRPGAVVVFSRGKPPQGHVAFVVKDEGRSVRVVGGNQRDAVTLTSYPKTKVLGYRWPIPALRSLPMARPKTTTRGKSLKSISYSAPVPVLAEVPVVNPNATATNAVSLASVITSAVLLIAQMTGAPLNAASVATLLAAMNVVGGLFFWAKNRWWNGEVTTTSVEHLSLKATKFR